MKTVFADTGYWVALLNQTKASVDVRYPFVDIEDSVCWVMQKVDVFWFGNHQRGVIWKSTRRMKDVNILS